MASKPQACRKTDFSAYYFFLCVFVRAKVLCRITVNVMRFETLCCFSKSQHEMTE